MPSFRFPDTNRLDELEELRRSGQLPQASFLEARGTAPLVGAFQDSVSVEAAPPAVIGRNEIAQATETLKKYKNGKANLEKRIVEDELWWQLRHWEAIGRTGRTGHAAPGGTILPDQPAKGRALSSSAWLFNALASKHADSMDNYPEPVALPREQSDEESAETISSVLPVVMEQCDFEETYSREWWNKLKHGTCIYSVLWNPDKDNGLGDIEISGVDMLKLFWEPGIEDLQDSHNIFLLELVEIEDMERDYPQLKGKLTGGQDMELAKYLHDDTIDTSTKCVVVDWYYKKRDDLTGRTLLHYVKYVGNEVLYASENDPAYASKGWYDHGLYPFFPDVLFPEASTPIGFGFVAICKDPQLYIDKLFSNVLETSMQGTKRRYFVSDGVDVNENELMDWNNPIIHVTGPVNEDRLKELVTRPLDSIYLNVIELKIDEMNKTANNRDVTNGSAGNGVTAASAIAALQEAGNKTSRDMISASYRTHVNITKMCIELMRQFYTVSRTFRITNEMPYTYAVLRPDMLADTPTGIDAQGEPLLRKPVFDIKIKAQKRNPFSRAEQNERAKELYAAGFFNPQRAQEALIALDMMEFEGIEKIKEQVSKGQTLYNMVLQLTAELQQTRALLSAYTGIPAAEYMAAGADGGAQQGGNGQTIQSREAQAQSPQTPMMSRMARNSKPNMSSGSNAAQPQA